MLFGIIMFTMRQCPLCTDLDHISWTGWWFDPEARHPNLMLLITHFCWVNRQFMVESSEIWINIPWRGQFQLRKIGFGLTTMHIPLSQKKFKYNVYKMSKLSSIITRDYFVRTKICFSLENRTSQFCKKIRKIIVRLLTFLKHLL